jgi:hypothetical protein
MRENISAYTAPGSNYPSFVSVNLVDNQEVEIMVRPEVQTDGRCGEGASMKMSQADFYKFAFEMANWAFTQQLPKALNP